MRRSQLSRILAVACAVVLLEGCAAGVIGAGVAAGAAAAHDRRTTGTIVDDGLIELKARDAISGDEALRDEAHINVTSFNNIVLLSGETPTAEMRERAGRLVGALDKVREVHNELRLAAPSAMLTRSSDSWITSKVKTRLLADADAPGSRVKVVTENGVVYLMGLVSRAEADTATDVARRVSGVQRVVRLFEYLD